MYTRKSQTNYVWRPGVILFKPDENILQSKEQYILNMCQSSGSKFDSIITEQIFKTYPYSNIYAERGLKDSNVGTIQIRESAIPSEKQKIINLITAKYSGKPIKDRDLIYNRFRYFIAAMNKVYKIPGLESLAYQEMMGCGPWGHNWNMYYQILHRYARKFKQVKLIQYQGIMPLPYKKK